MPYRVKEMFITWQGEGLNAGRRAVFMRMAGCNMWDGFPEHRHQGKGACAMWCDTDFARGEKMQLGEVIDGLDDLWPEPKDDSKRLLVISGGEPVLQLNLALITTLQGLGWEIAVETNGTVNKVDRGYSVLEFCDHVCVSPKLLSNGAVPELAVKHANELKIVLPGHVTDGCGWTEQKILQIERYGNWQHKFLQPMDPIDPSTVEVSALRDRVRGERSEEARGAGYGYDRNLKACLDYIAKHPQWRLSLQTHKLIDVP